MGGGLLTVRAGRHTYHGTFDVSYRYIMSGCINHQASKSKSRKVFDVGGVDYSRLTVVIHYLTKRLQTSDNPPRLLGRQNRSFSINYQLI